MSHARKIAQNTGLLFISELANKGIAFLLLILIARRLGELGYGAYSYAFAFVSLFVALSNLGLDTFLLKELARRKDKAKEIMGNAMGLRLATLLLSYGLAFVLAWGLPASRAVLPIIVLVMVHELLTALNAQMTILFKAFERNEFTVYTVTVDRLLALAAAAIVLSFWSQLTFLLIGLICAKLLAFFWYAFVASKKFVSFFFRFDFSLWKSMTAEALLFWMSRVFQVLYTQIDKVMLGVMAGFAATGWYSGAATLIDGLFFLPVIVMYANFPVMSRLFSEKSHDLLRNVYEKSLYMLLVIALPLSVGLWLLADPLISFIYGGQFVESAVVLRMLALLVTPLFVNYLIGFLLNAIDKQGLFTFAGGMAAILNILLNLFLIPLYVHKGAALATVVTQVVNFAFIAWLAARNGYAAPFHKLVYKPLIAAGIMGLALWWLPIMPMVGLVAIGGLLYLAVLLMLDGIPKEELELVLELLRIKSKS